MQTLNNNQIAFLYLICFNISEGNELIPGGETTSGSGTLDKHHELVNDLLKENGQISCDDYVPDEDGAPINASEEIYQAYQGCFINDGADAEMQAMSDFLDIKNPTKEELLKTLEVFS